MSIQKLWRKMRSSILFALAGFLVVPAAARAQVPLVLTGPAANQAIKLDELAKLKSAKKLLEEANHDYQGHRARAVHAIHQAIREIEHKGKGIGKHAPTTPANAAAKAAVRAAKASAPKTPAVHEAQAASDTQLRAAEQLLLKAQAELSTGRHPKASAHVQTAIQELEIALKII
jgi:hypothetical protein